MCFHRKHNGRKTAEVTCGTDQAGIKSPTLKREKIITLTKRIKPWYIIQPRKHLLTLKFLFILKIGSLAAYF